jgi:4-amino-4-deoxy-L-arabinose transferase-like glycosyltransferase
MNLKKPFPFQIFLVALLLRLIPAFLTRSLGIGLDDMFQYDMLARSLASGNGFRWYAYDDLRLLEPYITFDLTSENYDPVRGVLTSFRAPLYPAFLATIYLIVGTGLSRFFAARLAQAFLGALLAPLTYLVSLRLFPNNRPAASLSAWVIACYPLLIVYTIGLATENLFFPLLLLSFYFLLRTVGAPHWSLFVLAGVSLGFAALTRSVVLLFGGLCVLWAWHTLKNRRGAMWMALGLIIVIAPWVIRNSVLHEKLTGIETSLGYNLYLGYHPDGNGSFLFGPSLDLLPILDDVERESEGIRMAQEFIRKQPDRVITLAFNRLGFFFGLEKRVLMYFYSNDLVGYLPRNLLLAVSAILLLPFVLIAPAAVLGLGTIRLKPETVLLMLLITAYTVPHILILAEDRFHLALVPVFAILASQVWTGDWRKLPERWHHNGIGKVVVLLVVAAAILLVMNWGIEVTRDMDKIEALLSPKGNQTYFPY